MDNEIKEILEILPLASSSIIKNELEKKQKEIDILKKELKSTKYIEDVILENSPAVIYMKELNGSYSLVNRAFKDLFSDKKNIKIIGKTDYDLFSQDIAETFRKNDQEIIEKLTTQTSYETINMSDKNRYYMSVKFPLKDSIGKLIGTGGISLDITKIKKIEERLKQDQEMYKYLLHNLPDIIYKVRVFKENISESDKKRIIKDVDKIKKCKTNELLKTILNLLPRLMPFYDGVILDANKATYNMLGYPLDSIGKIKIDDIVLKNQKKALIINLFKIFNLGTSDNNFYTFIDYFHKEINVNVNSSLYNNEFPYEIIGVVRNIDEIKKKEERIRIIKQKTVLDTFTDGVSHHFLNYLTIIQGNLEFIKKELQANKSISNRLNKAYNASENIVDLINLLKIITKENHTNYKININDVIQKVYNEFFKEYNKRVNIQLDFANNLSLIKADDFLIRDLIKYILQNAYDFLPDNGIGGIISIKTENVSLDKEKIKNDIDIKFDNYIKLTISDNGMGISKQNLQKVFVPFFSTKKVGTGSGGFGLSIAQKIMIDCNGFINITSRVITDYSRGKTIVEMYFPAVSN